MRVLFALPGLHRYNRGAEVAFIAIALELQRAGDSVTLIGSGQPVSATSYRFLHARSLRREHFESFPALPALRDDCAYEELTFVPGLLSCYRPSDFDVTITCNYPFTNWILRRRTWRARRPPHVFVTENGDWPAQARNSEYRFFGCEGLVCTNPDYYERNKSLWRSRMIPNGIDCHRFQPGPSHRQQFRLPQDRPVILMVSALIPSKRVDVGVEAVSRIPDAHLVVAGDGPLRHSIETLAQRLLPGRFHRLTLPAADMPMLYRSADVFLHLSREEAFGNVFLEAMASGLPIVAHDTPRLRWITGGRELLVDTDNLAAISDQLELARLVPVEVRQAGVLRAADFSWNKIGEMYREFLAEVVANYAQR